MHHINIFTYIYVYIYIYIHIYIYSRAADDFGPRIQCVCAANMHIYILPNVTYQFYICIYLYGYIHIHIHSRVGRFRTEYTGRARSRDAYIYVYVADV